MKCLSLLCNRIVTSLFAFYIITFYLCIEQYIIEEYGKGNKLDELHNSPISFINTCYREYFLRKGKLDLMGILIISLVC